MSSVFPSNSGAPNRRMVSALTHPYGARVLGAATCFFLPFWIPPDVTQIRARIAINDQLAIAGNVADAAGNKVCFGTPDASLVNFATTPETESGITYPMVGSYGTTQWQPVNRNAAGYFAIGYTMPAGALYGEASQYYGRELAGTDPSNFTGSAACSAPVGSVFIEYDTDAIPVVFVGDSQSCGIGGSGEAGFLNAYHRLGPQFGFAVACNAIPAQSLQNFAAFTNWILPQNWLQSVRDKNVVVALGAADVQAARTAAQMLGDMFTIIRNVGAMGAKRVIPRTIPPSSAYTGAMNTEITYFNNAIRSYGDYYDCNLLVRDPGTPTQLQYPATGNIHWLTAGYTAEIVGMANGTGLPAGLFT